MQNPFTTTFSKVPEYTYISTEEPQRILVNFSYEHPAENVYRLSVSGAPGKRSFLVKSNRK